MTRDLLHLATGRRSYHHTTAPLGPDLLRILGSQRDCLRFIAYLKKYEEMEAHRVKPDFTAECEDLNCSGEGTKFRIKLIKLRKSTSPYGILVAYPYILDDDDEADRHTHVRLRWF